MNYSILITFCLVCLSACSPNDSPAPTPKLFSESRDALDKAKAVEGLLQQQNAAQQQAIDAQK
ncbi:MAG: hypothetical protein PXX73_03270 [Sideroxydans sp.]|nr:hypothetical protein [Sideroxydans sp.]